MSTVKQYDIKITHMKGSVKLKEPVCLTFVVRRCSKLSKSHGVLFNANYKNFLVIRYNKFTFILFKTSSKKSNALQHCNITGSKCKSEENIKEAIQHLYFLLGRRHIKLDYKIDNISCVVDLKNFIDIESIYLNQQDLVCSYQEENFPALVIYCPKHITSAAKLCCLVNKSGSCVLVGGKIKSEIVEFFSWLVLKIENYISNKSQDVI